MKNSYLLVILFLFFFINMQGQNSRNIKLLNRDSFESIIDGKKVSLYSEGIIAGNEAIVDDFLIKSKSYSWI